LDILLAFAFLVGFSAEFIEVAKVSLAHRKGAPLARGAPVV
jgi:hypothetical protein